MLKTLLSLHRIGIQSRGLVSIVAQALHRMGSKSKRKKKHLQDTSDDDSPSSSPSSSDDSERSSKRRRRHRHKSDDSSRREKERRRERREKRRSRRETKRSKSKKKKKRDYESGSGSSSGGDSERERSRVEPQDVLRDLLNEFPNVGDDLKQVIFFLLLNFCVENFGVDIMLETARIRLIMYLTSVACIYRFMLFLK